jgi:uncharacterized membrane protein YfcA
MCAVGLLLGFVGAGGSGFIISILTVGSAAVSGRKGFGFWLRASGIGIVTGVLSGLFGIGSTPFIQIGLLAVLGMSARQAAGTTMLVILPIAIAGGVGFLYAGHLDIPLLAEVVCGTMLGTFVGAKFTKRFPVSMLKTAMVLVPMIGGFILLL